jgi:hypothetical protein
MNSRKTKNLEIMLYVAISGFKWNYRILNFIILASHIADLSNIVTRKPHTTHTHISLTGICLEHKTHSADIGVRVREAPIRGQICIRCFPTKTMSLRLLQLRKKWL